MTKFVKPRCEKCAHYHQTICLLQGGNTQPTNLCSNYTESAYVCELCNKHLPTESVIWIYGNQVSHHKVCGNCANQINTCGTCKQANDCRFNQDSTIAEPLFVMQQVRQGPAIIQQQIKNPKREQLTCTSGCICFINGECGKADGNSCEKYECAVPNW